MSHQTNDCKRTEAEVPMSSPDFWQCIVVLGIFISFRTVQLLNANSGNVSLAVAVVASKLNRSINCHCVQTKRAKKLNHGIEAWPCIHNCLIGFQMSMAVIIF